VPLSSLIWAEANLISNTTAAKAATNHNLRKCRVSSLGSSTNNPKASTNPKDSITKDINSSGAAANNIFTKAIRAVLAVGTKVEDHTTTTKVEGKVVLLHVVAVVAALHSEARPSSHPTLSTLMALSASLRTTSR
jgi:hypothetical protein